MTPSIGKIFAAEWREMVGKKKKTQSQREINKEVVTKDKAHRAGKKERNTVVWRSVKKAAAQKRSQRPPAQQVKERGVGAFLGQRHIGFEGEYEPKILQHRGQEKPAPKGWSEDHIELQEQRDLVVMSRAPGTWASYKRWWKLYQKHAEQRGVDTRGWKRDDQQDEYEMVLLLRRMVNSMRKKYAYGTVNLLVSAVARAAKDFGWDNPRDDEVLSDMLKGLAKLKGVSKKKKKAILGNEVRRMMKIMGLHADSGNPHKLFGASDLRTVRGGADPSRMPPTGSQRASPKLFTISDGQSCFFGGIPFLDFAFAVTTIGWSRALRWTPECRCTNSNPAVPMGIVLTTAIAALMSNSCNLVIYPKVTPLSLRLKIISSEFLADLDVNLPMSSGFWQAMDRSVAVMSELTILWQVQAKGGLEGSQMSNIVTSRQPLCLCVVP